MCNYKYRSLIVLALCATVASCGGKESILPQNGETMLDVYARHAGSATTSALYDARSALRRPLTDQESDISPFVRDQLHEVQLQFERLPNPDLVMFTFPHLTTADEVPVPGYMTLFPMYDRVHYALPGEVAE